MTAPRIQRFLEQFFSHPNKLTLDRIYGEDPDKKAGRFQRWIEPLCRSNPEETLLPCQLGPRRVDWYGVAFSDLQFRMLGEELAAFVGPSYSCFRGARANLDPAHPVEKAVQGATEGRAYYLTAPEDPSSQADLWEALERMRRVRGERIQREPQDLRPVGRLLRDFFLALQVGSRDRAEEFLRQLRDSHQLGTWNVLFLRVQMLSDLGRWEELLAIPEIPDLMQVRRPLAVTEALVAAVYHQELEVFEFRGNPKGAAEHFTQEVRPRYGALFDYHTGMRAPEVAKSFLLLAVSGVKPDLELRNAILRNARLPSSQRRYLEQVAALAPDAAPEPMAEPLSYAAAALARGQFDLVFALASDAPPSLERARLLLHCAYELPALEVRRAALEAVRKLHPDERARLLDGRWAREFWQELAPDPIRGLAVELPAGWLEWLQCVEAGWSYETSIDIARQGSVQWTVESLLETPGTVAAITDGLLARRSPEQDALVRDAVPHLLAFMLRDPEWPRRGFLPVYEAVLLLLAMTEEGGEDELTLFNDVFAALLTLGIDAGRYSTAVGYAVELWNRFRAPRRIDWGLDLLDLLALFHAPAPEKRLELLQALATAFHKFVAAGRVRRPQWLLFQALCQELGHPEIAAGFPKEARKEETEAEIGFEALANRTIVIYTLTESVGRRVSSILRDACPSAKIDVCHDRVCTDALRSAARNADLFVMATASAKHAATDCVEANRPRTLPLLRSGGKGSSSMLSAIASYLENA